jgi:PST family polysaccharide transporter
VLGHFYVSRLPKIVHHDISIRELGGQWTQLMRLGVAFMGAAVALSLVQLWIRVDVGRMLGATALGEFQASWTVSTQYLVLALGAMGADYYPRLAGVIHDRKAAVRLINEQTEIALLLSAPILLAMMALAPWVLRLLYTAEFLPAAEILRWQILSDVLKVASWPLGFVLLALGDGRTFFLAEVAALAVLSGGITLLLSRIGIQITGIAFLGCYVFYLPLVHRLAVRRIGFRWSRAVKKLLALTFATCAAVGLLAVLTPWGAVLGCLLSSAFGIYGLGRLTHVSGVGGLVGRIGSMARRATPRGPRI